MDRTMTTENVSGKFKASHDEKTANHFDHWSKKFYWICPKRETQPTLPSKSFLTIFCEKQFVFNIFDELTSHWKKCWRGFQKTHSWRFSISIQSLCLFKFVNCPRIAQNVWLNAGSWDWYNQTTQMAILSPTRNNMLNWIQPNLSSNTNPALWKASWQPWQGSNHSLLLNI